MTIHKRDAFQMTPEQRALGKRMWDRTKVQGRLAQSSFNAEENAPKTWIMYVNNKGEEIHTIECELYQVGRASDPGEAVVMLHGMCPKCGETFITREDNKTLYIDRVKYKEAPKHIRVNWSFHARQKLMRRPRDEDIIAVVSSPERWACDYCKGWVVRVQGGVAYDDHSGCTQLVVPQNVPLIGAQKETMEF